jgi:hypothetical protein
MGVNHGVLYCVSGCTTTGSAKYTMIHKHWRNILHHDSPPLAQHSSPWFTIPGSTLHTMIHNHWQSIAHHDSQPLAQNKPTWFTTTGSA